jgi:hypothetical protein
MSALHKENDAVLPRGGSLAYSYRSANLPHISSTCSSRPSCDRSDASSITLLSDIDEMSDADDELDCGFWGSRASFDQARKVKYSHKKKSSHRSIYTFCCFWSAVSICTLGAIGAFFAADFVFTQFGMGTGKVNWMVYGNAGRQSTNYQVSQTSLVSFWLATAVANTACSIDALLSYFTGSPGTRAPNVALY